MGRPNGFQLKKWYLISGGCMCVRPRLEFWKNYKFIYNGRLRRFVKASRRTWSGQNDVGFHRPTRAAINRAIPAVGNEVSDPRLSTPRFRDLRYYTDSS